VAPSAARRWGTAVVEVRVWTAGSILGFACIVVPAGALLAASHGLIPDTVVIRHVQEPVQGTIRQWDGAGVLIVRTGDSTPTTIPWTRIASVEIAEPDSDRMAAMRRWLEASDGLWRGQQRLGRGDFEMACEGFAKASALFRDDDGEAGQLLMEGWLRSMIGRGLTADDLPAAWSLVLDAAARRVGSKQPDAFEQLHDPIADGFGLAPSVPPLFVPAKLAEAAIAAVPGGTGGAAAQEALRSRVLAIAAAEAGGEGSTRAKKPAKASDRDGSVEWVATMDLLDLWIKGLSGDDRARSDARERLGAMPLTHEWQRAWAALARARSWEREGDGTGTGEAVLAYVEAAEIASEKEPGLARLSAQQAARVLRGMGDNAAAERVIGAYAPGTMEGSTKQ